MKQKENYSALWQKKRNQLRIDGDVNTDWLQMRSVLDNHLPSSGLIKRPYNPGRLKWMYKFFIGFSITASISGVAYLSLSKKQNDQSRDISVKETHVGSSPATRDSKTVIIKNGNSPTDGKDHAATGKPGLKGGLSPHPQLNETSSMPANDSLEKKQENISSNETPHRDRIFSPINQTPPRVGIDSVGNINKPLKHISINNKAIQKVASDSVKQVKKKKRSKIGVFF